MGIEVPFILLVIGLPVYFIWLEILKKINRGRNPKKIEVWTATIVTTPIFYTALIALWFMSMSYHPTKDFDRKKWFAEKEKRYELSEDIIDSEILIGKTKAEIRVLLGDEGNSDAQDHWGYYLGFRPGFSSIDPDVLDIDFENGVVVRVGQHES